MAHNWSPMLWLPLVAAVMCVSVCQADILTDLLQQASTRRINPNRPAPNVTNNIQSDDNGQLPGATAGGGGGPSDRNPFVQWIQGILGGTTTARPPVDLQPPAQCPTCDCGVLNKKDRIVGGQETEVNQYPWMALLMYSGRFYCGATLINDRYVLTAAHCVNGFSAERISVRLLEHDRSTTTEAQSFERRVQRVVKHAGYNSGTYNNDIALVRLDQPIELSQTLRPVCLPTMGKSFTGQEGIVTGWGATQEHGEIATNLQEVHVPIMSNRECRQSGYGASRITDNMLCAGVKEGGRDSCQGDSGGPLHVNNGTHQIVGVVSWGEGCAKPNYPGVYTRVNRYGTWIRSNTKDACYC